MRLLARHSEIKKDSSTILQKAAIAKEAKKKDPSVINATIGMLFDENESFYTFNCVKEAEKELNGAERYAYGSTIGLKPYLAGVESWVLQDYEKEMKELMEVRTVATPGGSGALSNAFSNYLNAHETILLPSHMWGNYMQVAYENYLEHDEYELFTNEGTFNIQSLREKCLEYKKKQHRLMMVLNDPCHNPTGYSMTHEEWIALIKLINEMSADGTPFIFVYDMAYIDYDKNGMKASRDNIRLIETLNENVMSILCFSGSKTLGLYGLRIGAMIGITKNKEAIDDFINSMEYSARTKYSMSTTYGMNLIAKIFTEEKYRKMFVEELKAVRDMLVKRSNAFIDEANKYNIKTLPFKCGFFVSVICEQDDKAYEYLANKGVYVVPLGGTLRITLASISLENCKKLPKLLREALDYAENHKQLV